MSSTITKPNANPEKDKIDTLLAWCATHHITLDPRLRIVDGGGAGGVCVQAVERIGFEEGAGVTVASIPKAAILSPRTCTLARDIPFEPYGHGAVLALALAVYGEILLDTASRWHGYLQSLPRGMVDIGLFWGEEEVHAYWDGVGFDEDDGERLREEHVSRCGQARREALRRVQGTGVEGEMVRKEESGMTALEEIREYYGSVVEPVVGGRSTRAGFYRAYSLVSSRAFMVDWYHGLGMVPIADGFNHSKDNQVHLESEFDVCCTCGSLSECEHDGGTRQEEEEDTCDMVVNRTIEKGEVFNTYGEDVSDAEFVVRYGMCVWE